MALNPPRNNITGMEERESCFNLTHEYAKNYVREVKREFVNDVRKNATFRQHLRDFANKRFEEETINVHDLISQVKELFQGHQKLLVGFNAFLLDKDKIKLEEVDDLQSNEAHSEEKLNNVRGQILSFTLDK